MFDEQEEAQLTPPVTVVEKPYCTCGKDANMGMKDGKEYKCFHCGKPNYANWWASEMNKTSKEEVSWQKWTETLNPDQLADWIILNAKRKEKEEKELMEVKSMSRQEEREIFASGYKYGIIFEKEEFNKKLNKAITDSVVKGGMVNGDCYLSLDLFNKYLKD